MVSLRRRSRRRPHGDVGGWLEQGGTNNAVEIYTNPDGWSQEYNANFTPELYPWLHLLPDGRIFMSGSNISRASSIGDELLADRRGHDEVCPRSRLRLFRAAAARRRRQLARPHHDHGGDNPATETAEIIDLSQSSPSWRTTNSMSGPRIQMDAVILPTGKVLALGGSAVNLSPSTATLQADLFDPATETWTPAER